MDYSVAWLGMENFGVALENFYEGRRRRHRRWPE